MTVPRAATCWAALALLTTAGCGGGPAGPTPDVQAAREALDAALASWKAGDAPDRLKGQAKPIEFTDDDRRTGFKLLEYTVKETKADGDQVRCVVALSLQDRKGKKVDKEVHYLVALKSPVIVARDPYY